MVHRAKQGHYQAYTLREEKEQVDILVELEPHQHEGGGMSLPLVISVPPAQYRQTSASNSEAKEGIEVYSLLASDPPLMKEAWIRMW